MYKDANCTCKRYCDCEYPPCEPCGCAGMATDPHCQWCCQHLNPDEEAKWHQEWHQEIEKYLSASPKEY